MNKKEIEADIYMLLDRVRDGFGMTTAKKILAKILDEYLPPDLPKIDDKYILEQIVKEKNLAQQTAKQELNKLLGYTFNHLDNTQTKLMRSKDKDLQFNIGYNEGTYKTVKELKIVLEELWQEMTSNFMKKKNPQREESGLTQGPWGILYGTGSTSIPTMRPPDNNENTGAPF